MKRIISILVVLIVIAISAVAQDKETRSLSSFDEVSAAEAINVYLKQGSKEEAVVEIKRGNAELEDVLTDVTGDRLRIHMAQGRWRDLQVDVYVTYKELNAISASSAADVIGESVIKADELELDASSAGDIEVEVDVNSLEVDISSSGSVDVEGRTSYLEVDVSSAGSFRGLGLDAEDADLEASSAGSIKAKASRKIDASASSGGSIRYSGNPDKEYIRSNSGGSVRKSN